MRRMLDGRAGMILAFTLGVAIATAGSATAARLITGKQVKDGSISSKDLSKAIRAQLAKAGRPGPAGPAGAAGAKGDAGAQGAPGTARAFARIILISGEPFVDPSRDSRGIVGARREGTPMCILLDRSIDASKALAIINPAEGSVDFTSSGSVGFGYQMAASTDCRKDNGVGVYTGGLGPNVNSGNPFGGPMPITILVP